MRPSLTIALGFLVAAPLAAQDPLPVTQLDTGLGISKYPSVATDGSIVAAVWLEDGTNNLYCAASSDGGNTWGAAVQMDDGTGSSKWIYDYNLAVAGGSIYFAWRDQRNGSVEDIYFTASHDAGASWSADLRLDDGDAPGGTAVDSVTIVQTTFIWSLRFRPAFPHCASADRGGLATRSFWARTAAAGGVFGLRSYCWSSSHHELSRGPLARTARD